LPGAAGFHLAGLTGYNATMSETPPARKLFGTDGIRGKANAAPMDAATALRLGQAAGSYFNRGNHRHRVVIGIRGFPAICWNRL